MKKFLTITGSISSIVGFVLFLTAQIIISSETRYTWRKPYTAFEAQTLTLKWVGIILLICGILDIILIIVSKYYENKNSQDIDVTNNSSVQCPNCGLLVNKETKICPKCKNSLK